MASIEDEESFLVGQRKNDTPRRQSAASNAALLKAQNLIPPLNPPSDRRLSLPRAKKLVAMQALTSKKPSAANPAQNMADSSSARDKALLDQIDAMIKASSNRVRQDIAGLEISTGKKAAVAKKLETKGTGKTERRPRQIPPTFSPNDNNHVPAERKEERYWEARRSLRMWPVIGEDLKKAVIQFLTEKMQCPIGRLAEDDINMKRTLSRPEANAQEQVRIKFSSVRLGDEFKALARNLAGQDKVGVQLEPPDYLRTQYQSFQKLAYKLRSKNPGLRRNIKFCNQELCLTMDILKPGGEWKTIMIEDAMATLR